MLHSIKLATRSPPQSIAPPRLSVRFQVSENSKVVQEPKSRDPEKAGVSGSIPSLATAPFNGAEKQNVCKALH